MKSLLLLLAVLASPAAAQSAVALQSSVQLERKVVDASGKVSVKLEEPAKVVPGDSLLFTIRYENKSGKAADNFVVNNPIPGGVQFAGDESDGADFSVDEGKSFGTLASLKVNGADGTPRAAGPADVTNIRWKFARPVAAGAKGTLQFHAIVK